MKTKAQLKAVLKLVKDEYAPDGKYTHKIICIECKSPRMVKPQDVHQVKRCIPCQTQKKGVKLKALIEKVRSPQHAAEVRYQRRLAKLNDWVERNNHTVESTERMLEALKERVEAEKKLKRIWP